MCSFSKDAKLGKKCTLLDLSRRPSVAAPDAQVSSDTVINESKDQESSILSESAADRLTSVEDLESGDSKAEEKKDGKEKSEDLLAEESPEKMGVDPAEPPSEEEQSKSY